MVAAGVAVLLGTFALAGWLMIGSTVVAASGTLPGGWHEASVELAAILVGGVGLAMLLFWSAAKKPKPLRGPDD